MTIANYQSCHQTDSMN